MLDQDYFVVGGSRSIADVGRSRLTSSRLDAVTLRRLLRREKNSPVFREEISSSNSAVSGNSIEFLAPIPIL